MRPPSLTSTRRARSKRAIVVALSTVLTHGCATTLVAPAIHGPYPPAPLLDGDAPLVAATLDGQALTLRLRRDDGVVLDHVAAIDAALTGLPIVVQLDTYAPEPRCPVQRLDRAGRELATSPLDEDELDRHLVVVLPPERTAAYVFAPGDRNEPLLEVWPAPRSHPLFRLRVGLHAALLPVLVAFDVATAPLQLPIFVWMLRR